MTPTTTADASMERKRFEAAMKDTMFMAEPLNFEKLEDGFYCIAVTRTAWKAWEARAAIIETNASTEREELPGEHNAGMAEFLAPKEAAEPTREASREASIRIDEIVAWLNRPANKARIEGNLRLAAEAIAELDRARRVSWEDMNTPLGVAAPRTEAAAVAPDAVTLAQLEEVFRGRNHALTLDDIRRGLAADFPDRPTAPSNVREQASEGYDAWPHPQREAELLHEAIMQAVGASMEGKCEYDILAPLRQALVDSADRALKSATPDAGKGETT